jgi:hypothetical protein
MVGRAVARLGGKRHARGLMLSATLAFLGCIALSYSNLTSMPFEPDTASYLFQAKLFAHGRAFAEAPPDFGFSASPHININDGKWYTRYPPLWPLMLAPGTWFGEPIVMPALFTALTLVFLYGFVKDLFRSRKVASLATFLAMVSPLTLGVGSTLFSQTGSRLLLVIFLWALNKALKSHRACLQCAAIDRCHVRRRGRFSCARGPVALDPAGKALRALTVLPCASRRDAGGDVVVEQRPDRLPLPDDVQRDSAGRQTRVWNARRGIPRTKRWLAPVHPLPGI